MAPLASEVSLLTGSCGKAGPSDSPVDIVQGGKACSCHFSARPYDPLGLLPVAF